MVYREDGRNIPRAVGPLNMPFVPSWGAGRSIANLPSVVMGGLDRSFLPQALRERPIAKIIASKPIRGILRGQMWWPFRWPASADVARVPSVVGILEGPRRTLLPQRDFSVQME